MPLLVSPIRVAFCLQAQRARGKLIREVKDNFKVHAFVGNATDWERVCLGNLVGMPVIIVPTDFKKIANAPSNSTRRRTTVTTGIYAPPEQDHIVSSLTFIFLLTLYGFESRVKTLFIVILSLYNLALSFTADTNYSQILHYRHWLWQWLISL